MTRSSRILACVLALALPAAALATWSLRSARPTARRAEIQLPGQLGPWHATREDRLEPDVFRSLRPDFHILRLFEARDRHPVWLYLAVYLGRAGYGKGAHDPEICYPGQGWEIVSTLAQGIDLTPTDRMIARAMHVHRGHERESVLYWFQPSGRWAMNGALEQLMRLVDATRGRARYAFVRLSTRSVEGDGADADLRDLAARLAPEVRDALDRLESTR
ncbi:MAG: exosortase C-terminal domain/associated protein EpsI [Myxococcota bacterium]